MEQTNSSSQYFVGIDVGGTNIKCGIVNGAGETLARVQSPTNAKLGPECGVETITSAVRQALAESKISLEEILQIGVATPGTMDIQAGLLLDPPNLPGWQNFPIRQRIADYFEKPTILQNDANAAAYGEFWQGAAQNARSLVFWTLGTGIGCGIIIGDTIIEGANSHGSECGHIIIEMDNGRPCDTGQYGTLEAYASAKSLIRRCQEALGAGAKSILHEQSRKEELTPLLIAKAAEAGDQLANDLIMESARCLGVGTTSLIHTINPDMVLFGGAMTFGRHESELGRRFLQKIRDEVKLRAFPVPAEKTIIDYALLGGNAGYIGAAGCAKLNYDSLLKEDPTLSS